jgi:hypothetical protein
VPEAGIIFHWDPPDDPDGNWQHVFQGHDVAPDEVEALIREHWNALERQGGVGTPEGRVEDDARHEGQRAYAEGRLQGR